MVTGPTCGKTIADAWGMQIGCGVLQRAAGEPWAVAA